MIEFKFGRTGDLEIVQYCGTPTVYLDHWALRRISEKETFASRFTEALKSRNGTLALSWLNVVEFAKVTMERQARHVEVLLEANLPRVFFLEVEPFTVIRKEDKLLVGSAPAPPHADVGFLTAFVQLKPTSLRPFTAHDLFRIVQGSSLTEHLDRLADSVVDRVEALRDELEGNAFFRSAVRRLPSGPRIQRGTRFLLREMLRTLLVDKRLNITRNHAIDLLHAIVPVAYCDLVLLDKHWHTQVERVRQRFLAAGMSVPMARVFSEKANGIDQFLSELEKG